ncbi:GNAT family N-acetyltransferase [Pontibacter kalidii]|uniref:GNAT family N-acetyltransferase n=1 Tax=Pontibacter kalidii TaxID=2592049 RepID=UPI00224D0AF2|nr:GNAT family N-acetyltransferase [Pontibacter kalidii]
MIKIEKYSELTPSARNVLNQLIEEEFGHVAFVQERVWAQPEWVLTMYENGEVATVCHVVLREVSMDGKRYKVAGINNVITPKNNRGKGYASQVLREAEKLVFEELGYAYALLLCADALLPFYSRTGWYKVEDCALYYHQPTGEEIYNSNVMLLPANNLPPYNPKYINLNGLPW